MLEIKCILRSLEPPVNRKAEITRRVLDLLPEQDRVPFEVAMNTWWRNLRNKGGLSLTDLGLRVFKEQAELECHEFVIPRDQPISQGSLLRLDRGQQWPYHLDKKRRITFFGSREAMMMALYGNFSNYVHRLPGS